MSRCLRQCRARAMLRWKTASSSQRRSDLRERGRRQDVRRGLFWAQRWMHRAWGKSSARAMRVWKLKASSQRICEMRERSGLVLIASKMRDQRVASVRTSWHQWHRFVAAARALSDQERVRTVQTRLQRHTLQCLFSFIGIANIADSWRQWRLYVLQKRMVVLGLSKMAETVEHRLRGATGWATSASTTKRIVLYFAWCTWTQFACYAGLGHTLRKNLLHMKTELSMQNAMKIFVDGRACKMQRSMMRAKFRCCWYTWSSVATRSLHRQERHFSHLSTLARLFSSIPSTHTLYPYLSPPAFVLSFSLSLSWPGCSRHTLYPYPTLLRSCCLSLSLSLSLSLYCHHHHQMYITSYVLPISSAKNQVADPVHRSIAGRVFFRAGKSRGGSADVARQDCRKNMLWPADVRDDDRQRCGTPLHPSWRRHG